ncbi:unnamed protein product [Cyclocybe aegerita]|uniref:Midasin n=1 Tax=Cyclocybe aegerita TaxID=1973307 RepID=A0A8S0W403_CYCAE|nr:unnamed protein product [Cyclocybe aegerita]
MMYQYFKYILWGYKGYTRQKLATLYAFLVVSNPEMTFASAIHDPLAINLHRQTSRLLTSIPEHDHHHASLHNASSTRQLLAALSSTLAAPAYTQLVATLFRPLLIDLCARWLEMEGDEERHLVALCYLVEVHEELFPILNLLLKRNEDGPLWFIIQQHSPLSIEKTRLQRILLAYYRILSANRQLPDHLQWSLAPLSKLIWTPQLDNGVRLLAIQCYALQSGMGEVERNKMEQEVLGESCRVECQLNYGQDREGTEKMVDGWVLPVVELRRIQEQRNEIATNPIDYFSEETQQTSSLRLEDLCPFIANVHGVLLLRSSPIAPTDLTLIPTPSSIKALRQLALHLSLRLPTLLTSSPSAGKALLISHLAGVVHPDRRNQIVTIHLADTSLDPRSLLGSYVSSTTHPGTFEWKEGVLVRCMREGKWVVLEDVDRGSSEVLGAVKPLVESLGLHKWIGGRARLDVPGHGFVVAHDLFMIFATRSLLPSGSGTFHSPTFFGSQKFSEMIVDSPSPEELRTIIDAKFRRLAGGTAQAAIDLWRSVKELETPSSTRDIGLRDLEKFCQRLERLLSSSHQPMSITQEHERSYSLGALFPNPTLREDMYLEARDVFFGSGALTAATRAHSELVARVIGEQLCLDSDRQEWILHGRTPGFEIEKDAKDQIVAVQFGRTRLAAQKSPLIPTSSRPFAMHKPAISLLSRIASSISNGEPILLTGETGTGKTSVLTYLASLLGRPLISLNLSNQTESADLLGGLKPVDARVSGSQLQEIFLDLFGATFSRRKNEKFETEVRKAVNECRWKRSVGLWKESIRLAVERIQFRQTEHQRALDDETPRKRRKTEPTASVAEWLKFLHLVEEFEVQHVQGQGKFAFAFVEGPLVKALRSGDWILLDEVNLASPETLECITGLLHGPTASITLTEHGSLEPIPRHPDFRLFACMNPATDVGKKDLPPDIRSRFTEMDVPSPDADQETLLTIISQYVGHVAVGDKRIIMDVAEFYRAVKQESESRRIADGANHRPHFSMRTLTRALTFAADTASTFSLRRSIWEGCLMAFTMVLDADSAKIVTKAARDHLLSGVRNISSLLAREPAPPADILYAKFGPFYLEKGPFEEHPTEEYIITPSVERKLIDLARIILTRRFPVLIEGPTSSGKTSSIEYLAKRTGHRFIRINNHEHTDIQEYLGSYVSDPFTGKLVFKDGLLVQALRRGDWIVLDELNLAPTEVLEALNRLLDDNRELVIPETQEIVRPHPHFMLFATQNPPGLYAGRKILSRAFRNRFLEVHFDDVPQSELETILCQRCRIAPSYGRRIVSVFRELQQRRQTSRIFESRQGFATLRDLFRWAGRDAVGYQELADNGYMLLAERTRRPEDKAVVKEVLESVMGVRVDEDAMYDFRRHGPNLESFLGNMPPPASKTVWTKAMQRLYTLVCRGLKYNEPILLVGDTGSGKTSVCQAFTDATSQRLITVNCHQNTETADLIGGLRPVRNRGVLQASLIEEAVSILQEFGEEVSAPTSNSLTAALASVLRSSTLSQASRLRLQKCHHDLVHSNSIFEWRDGPLIEAMQEGNIFLLDEISLADDSVLERLNSVLEPGRLIVLAERGGASTDESFIRASKDFKLLATMNPGGDYGKKELSPALRNRFTEIWVPPVDDFHDVELIVNRLWGCQSLQAFTGPLLSFVQWLCLRTGDRSLMGLRDILAWVGFMNATMRDVGRSGVVYPRELFHHAAHMTYLDGLSSFPQLAGYSREALNSLKDDAEKKLEELIPLIEPLGSSGPTYDPTQYVQLGSFALDKGSLSPSRASFNFNAPTTLNNAMRVVRACQVAKPILLEGSPGVGKTSLITALANISGHELCRINLSDQTDLVDLFGSDLPVEGGTAGEFMWKDAEFLRALQEGHWVLLDEMNLAPQAVLEGLNAVLDHRGTVYIPELNRSFDRHPSFRVFAAQNPLLQGGGRKGLPKSFVNRFTKVYIEELTPSDIHIVCSQIFSGVDENVLRAMIAFNIELSNQICAQRLFAQDGSPWEFNLRDVLRWGALTFTKRPPYRPQDFLRSVYLHRFRISQDRSQARQIFDAATLTSPLEEADAPAWTITASEIHIGHLSMTRRNFSPLSRPRRVLKMQLSALQALGDCVSQSWLAIVTGPNNSGKSSVIHALASITGNQLLEVSIHGATDTMDILGSFEQVDARRRLIVLFDEAISLLHSDCSTKSGSKFAIHHQNKARRLREQYAQASAGHFPNLGATAIDFFFTLTTLESPSKLVYTRIHSDAVKFLSQASGAGQFEWVDGPLIKAMKSGNWMVLDGANLCSPSVLDRLNSLCEAGGTLSLSERGFVDGHVQVIRPHPDFRLFMTVDPRYGELSRAMRNRGIEVALISNPAADDLSILLDYSRLPLASSLSISNMTALQFDAARRGLSSQVISSTLFVRSTGHSLDQHSNLAALVDTAPSLLLPSLPTQDIHSWIFFLARSLAPSSMPLLTRYLLNRYPKESVSHKLLQFIYAFPPHILDSALQELRWAFVQEKHISVDSLLAQPMDFYSAQGRLFGGESQQLRDGDISHSMVVEVLNLSASIFLDQTERFALVPDHVASAPESSLRIRQAAIAVIQEIGQVSQDTLRQAPMCDLPSVKLASRILSFTEDLKRVLKSSEHDFSTIYSISERLLAALADCPASFNDILEYARVLRRSVSLSTGLRIFEIWSKLYLDELPKPMIETVKSTERLMSSLGDSSNAFLIRKQAFTVICLETLPPPLESHRPVSLGDLQLTLQKCLLSSADKSTAQESLRIDWRTILLEFYVLSACRASSIQSATMQEIVDMNARQRTSPLARLAHLQHLVWALDANLDHPSLFVRANIRWLEGLWEVKMNSSSPAGPSILFQPVLLRHSVAICDITNVPLLSLTNHQQELHQHARLVLNESKQASSRMAQLAEVYYQTLLTIISCFSSSYESEDFSAIQTSTAQDWSNFPRSFQHVLLLLQRSKDEALIAALQKELLPLVDLLPKTTTLQFLGLAWIGCSRLLFNLIIPDTPIDPAGIQNCAYSHLLRDQRHLRTQIDLHQKLEFLVTGNASNSTLAHLKFQLDEVQGALAQLPNLPRRDHDLRLHLFWTEVAQFQETVLHTVKINGLLDAVYYKKENASLRERVIQESLEGFYQRLESVYPEFPDLIVLLKFGILQMRLGLRTLVDATSAPEGDLPARSTMSLLAFPSANSSSRIINLFKDAPPSGSSVFKGILITLAASVVLRQLGLQERDFLSSIHATYERAAKLWLIDRAKEKKTTEEASSLYRQSKMDYSAKSDAEVEQQEFLAMFPTFEEALSNNTLAFDVDQAHPSSFIQPSDMPVFLRLHYHLVESSCDPSSFNSVVEEFSDLKHSMIHTLMTSSTSPLPACLDRTSIHFQFNLLRDTLFSLDCDAATIMPYNFYSTPNYREVKKCASIVLSCRKRLQNISDEWPDQMVLKHLIERCDSILNVASSSPVAKLLSMIEQLLVQSDDWEMYANRENSLKAHREDLIRLVVDWRRLELSSWQGLLESQAASLRDELAEWWFRLYDVIVRVPSSLVTQDQKLDEATFQRHFQELAPLLNEFITSSPLGQFHARLRMIRSFEHYIVFIQPLHSVVQNSILQRVERILHATYQYYQLFSESLQKHLLEQKSPLDMEIKALVKLASWKDVNVEALKQSAKQTHVRLYKVVKKFRDVLRQPVIDKLQPFSATDADGEPLSLGENDDPALSVTFPDSLQDKGGQSNASQNHIFHIRRTFGVYVSLISKQLCPFIRRCSPQLVDDVAVEIIRTARSLASIVIPPGPLQEKQLKALLVRKRKAWSDLLKELKHAGFSNSLKPEVLRQHTDQLWIKEQPIMPKTPADISVDNGERYFTKLCGSLTILRSSLPNHHGDLTTRELQRGQMFLESGFSMALDLRNRLTMSLTVFGQISTTLGRLKQLSSSSENLVPTGPNLHEHISSLLMAHVKISHGLSELLKNVPVVDYFAVGSSIPDSLLGELSDTLRMTVSLENELRSIVSDISPNMPPILQKWENKLLLRATEHISQVNARIIAWRACEPRLGYLFLPLQEWLNERTPAPLFPSESTTISDDSKFSSLLNSLLLSIQAFVHRCSREADGLQEDHPEKYALKGYHSIRDFTHFLSLAGVNARLNDFLASLTSRDDISGELSRVIPFLNLYLALAKDQLVSHSRWTKALFKLNFILCSILHTLCEQGFCKPPNKNDAGAELPETSDGVGIGEGSGTENASKDIQDESQIEGLKGDNDEDQGAQDRHEDGGAIEMDNDFSGDLEDLPDDCSDNADQSDAGSEADLNEILDELDRLDPSTIDEKMWGDEKGSGDSNDTEEKADQDHSKEQGGASEVVAKESEHQSKTTEKTRDDRTSREDMELDKEEKFSEGEEEESSEPNTGGGATDEHVPEANTLDLPDDIDLVGDEAERDEAGKMEEEETAVDPQIDDFAMHDPSREPLQDEDEGELLHSEEGSAENDAEKAYDTNDEGVSEDAIAQPDMSKADGTTDQNEVPSTEVDGSASTGEAGVAKGRSGEACASDEKTLDGNSSPEGQATEMEPTDHSGTGSAMSGLRQGQDPSQSESQCTTVPNPLRSLSDMLKEIRQRFDEILSGDQDDTPHEYVGDSNYQSQIEYLRPQDADHNMQALGPAGEEQVAKLDQITIVDEEMKVENAFAPMDVDETPTEDHVPLPQQAAQPSEVPRADRHDDAEGAILQVGRRQTSDLQTPHPLVRAGTAEVIDDDQNTEMELTAWRAADYPESGAEHIWRLYESLTHDLAYTLCEQLRLILEPTLATRLKGDYRTGKRLNMKRVISYIASDYTKDKIWLRRTKPSTREYQVLISIDDSRSMAESHSIHLAYQALALISKALSRLESGDVAISKFGETVDLLHGFDQGPFTEQAGTKVLNAFRFTQKATNVSSLLQTSLKALEKARERKAMCSASSADLWQLQIIISDGMCQDHEGLRPVLRKAEEQRVMIVFVIIDSLQATDPTNSGGPHHGSILQMEKAELRTENGKTEICMQKYLESFPFEYYVVLRNVEALPDVLAGTLKQFFERISEE